MNKLIFICETDNTTFELKQGPTKRQALEAQTVNPETYMDEFDKKDGESLKQFVDEVLDHQKECVGKIALKDTLIAD